MKNEVIKVKRSSEFEQLLTSINFIFTTSSACLGLAVFIIIFEMQNFNSNKQSPAASLSSPRGHDDFQKIFHRLRDLQEVQDESRNELCPVFLDEESLIKTRRESNWSAQQVPTHVDILKELQDTAQPNHSPLPAHRRSTYNLQLDQDLRDSNRKLQEDNRKLFNECIRLRKICRLQESAHPPFTKRNARESTNHMQSEAAEERRALKQQVEELKAQNANLSGQIKAMSQQLASQRAFLQRYDSTCLQLQQASRANDELLTKVVNLERQLQAAASRSASKSSQSISINNSTQESRKTEVEKDRMISNMKIVHESEKLKLRNIIEELKKELARNGQSASFTGVVSPRKK